MTITIADIARISVSKRVKDCTDDEIAAYVSELFGVPAGSFTGKSLAKYDHLSALKEAGSGYCISVYEDQTPEQKQEEADWRNAHAAYMNDPARVDEEVDRKLTDPVMQAFIDILFYERQKREVAEIEIGKLKIPPVIIAASETRAGVEQDFKDRLKAILQAQ